MNTNLRRVADLLKTIEQTQGISYNINTGELNPTSGYMVSHNCCTRPLKQIDESEITAFISDHASILAEDHAFFGVWFDSETKEFVLDVSYWYERRTDAAFWAIIHQQKAIWDCSRKEAIRIKHKNRKEITRKYVEAL